MTKENEEKEIKDLLLELGRLINVGDNSLAKRQIEINAHCYLLVASSIESLRKTIDEHQKTATELQESANSLTKGIKKLTFWIMLATIVGAVVALWSVIKPVF